MHKRFDEAVSVCPFCASLWLIDSSLTLTKRISILPRLRLGPLPARFGEFNAES